LPSDIEVNLAISVPGKNQSQLAGGTTQTVAPAPQLTGALQGLSRKNEREAMKVWQRGWVEPEKNAWLGFAPPGARCL